VVKNLDFITHIINSELTTVSTWFNANLLSLNINKTNYILFSNKTNPDIQILIGNEKVARVFQTKFLGIIIQANLKWKEHISLVANKTVKTLGVMNKIKHFLTSAYLKKLVPVLD